MLRQRIERPWGGREGKTGAWDVDECRGVTSASGVSRESLEFVTRNLWRVLRARNSIKECHHVRVAQERGVPQIEEVGPAHQEDAAIPRSAGVGSIPKANGSLRDCLGIGDARAHFILGGCRFSGRTSVVRYPARCNYSASRSLWRGTTCRLRVDSKRCSTLSNATRHQPTSPAYLPFAVI